MEGKFGLDSSNHSILTLETKNFQYFLETVSTVLFWKNELKKWKTFWFCLKKKFNLAHFKIYWLSKNSHILPKSRLFCCKGFFLFLEVPTKQDNWLCSWFSLWWCFSAWTLPVSKPVNQYFYLCINTILSCAFSHFIAK